MTPPTGGRAASCERAGGASKVAMTKIAMTMSVLMKPDRDMSGKLSCFLPTRLAFPEESNESRVIKARIQKRRAYAGGSTATTSTS